MYDLIQALSMAAYVVILTIYAKKYDFSRIKAFFAALCVMAVDFTTILLLTWIESGFKSFGSQNAVRVFVISPLWIYVIAKVTKFDYKKLNDYHAAPAVMWYAIGHVACIFAGCCQGFAYYEGTTMYKIAHALTGTNMLPNQILETLSAFIISLVLFSVAKRRNYDVKGYLYNIMLIVYGLQRFLWEFLRDNEKVVVFGKLKSADGDFGISSLAFWALAMVVVGAVLLAIAVYKDKKSATIDRKIEAEV